MTTTKRDEFNAKITALFHADFPDAAERLYARSQELWGPTEVKKPEDEQVQRLATLVAKLPVCDDGKRGIAKILSELTSKKIELVAEKTFDLKPGMMAVPVVNHSGHDYPIGEACVMVTNHRALRNDGKFGNFFARSGNEVRVASLEEIRAFVAKLVVKWHYGLIATLEGDYDFLVSEMNG